MWHLLPIEALMAQPFKSIFFLHSQPPVLNILFYLSFAQQSLLGIDPRLFATIMFSMIGLASCIVWYFNSLFLMKSHALSALVVLLIVLNPAFYFYDRSFQYANLELCEIGIFFLSVIIWTNKTTTRRLMFAMLALALIVYTRSLYHPIAGFLFAMLAFAHLWRKKGDLKFALRSASIALSFFILLVAPWMIKNACLFNTAGFSSWSGLNLKTNLADARTNCPAWHFVKTGQFDQKLVESYYSPGKLAWLKQQPALSIVSKNTPPLC